ncbi:hypothetical protein LMG10661_03710 [Ralstonia syzygii subsp. syzygii]|nr:hypothetical protein LMG10661_03710 [Ralstonia syzygii subsp. syzygii]
MAIAPEQLDALRPHLLRFAQLQLRDPALAEDVVADTVLAVLEHPERFAGNASLKTYYLCTGVMTVCQRWVQGRLWPIFCGPFQ